MNKIIIESVMIFFFAILALIGIEYFACMLYNVFVQADVWPMDFYNYTTGNVITQVCAVIIVTLASVYYAIDSISWNNLSKA